jgi:hypothetical protein
MDLAPTDRSLELAERLLAFMADFVYPAEEAYATQRRAGDPHRLPPVVAELQDQARERGLWNLFMRDSRWGPGLTNGGRWWWPAPEPPTPAAGWPSWSASATRRPTPPPAEPGAGAAGYTGCGGGP